MKKILAIAVAVMMVMALSVSVFADEVLFEKTADSAIGWTTFLESGSEEAAQFTEAIQTEGAVVTLTGEGLTEDKAAEGYYFQLASQDQSTWSGNAAVSENIGEEYAFSDTGYTVTFPAKAFYDKVVADGGFDMANAAYIINGGNFSDANATVTLTVTVPDVAASEPAADETAPADEAEPAPAPETEAPAAEAETIPAPETEVPVAEAEPAPATGIALCLIPAVVALGAVAVSKKR